MIILQPSADMQDLARATLCAKTHNSLQVSEPRLSKITAILAHARAKIHFITHYLARHALTKTLVSFKSSKQKWSMLKATYIRLAPIPSKGAAPACSEAVAEVSVNLQESLLKGAVVPRSLSRPSTTTKSTN